MSKILPYEEKELLSRIAEGDEEAFSILFYNYLGRLKPFVAKFTVAPADAREIIQETFVRLWINRDKLQQVSNPSAYIFRIAANQYHLLLRKQLSQEKAFKGYQTITSEVSDTTASTVRLKELQRLVNEAVARLPEKRRKIFLMSRVDGMTINEIATTLNISPKTVKNTINTALGYVRSYLTAAGESAWCFGLLFFVQ